LKRLGDLPETDFFKTSLSSAENFVNDLFTRESYSLENIADITGETAESITQKYLLTRSGEPMPAPPEGFLIRQRALHVFTEADRVERSCAALRKNDTETFGLLMNASHESCDRNYGISTPELNTLVTIMRSLGVSGARLTGAGFGGCAVALVHDEKVQSVIDGIHSFYYHDYLTKTHPEILKTGDLKNPVFPVKPSSGAIVMNLL
jgi:galactokinase